MANTYTQLYYHIVLGVEWRRNLIAKEWKIELYKYISGIVRNENEKLLKINGVPNHVHLLLSTRGNCNLSELIRIIKCNSSKWINERKNIRGNFRWQKGYGAFSVGQSEVKRIENYIDRQEEHHARKSFRNEYREILNDNGVDYREEYIFD